MSGHRQHALAAARKLVRTFASAPDARRRAQAIVSELRHADEWSAPEQREIEALDLWLRGAPPLNELQPRCQAAVSRLGQ